MGLSLSCGKAFPCNKTQHIAMVLKVIKLKCLLLHFRLTNLFVSSQDVKMFSLEMNSAKPMHLILTSPDKNIYSAFNLSTDVHVYVSNVSLFWAMLTVRPCSHPAGKMRCWSCKMLLLLLLCCMWSHYSGDCSITSISVFQHFII